MGTIWIRELKGGLDVRRLPETSPGGTLLRGRDGHITRGGDFEQRADFRTAYTLPAGLTKGFTYTPAGLVVFGHQTAPTMPLGVTYQRLQHPSGLALVDVPFATLYQSKLQVIGQFADGSRHVFYDGARVTDPNAPPQRAASGTPNVLLTNVEKMWIGSGENLFFSAVRDSTDFGAGAGVGEGVIVMSTHAEGGETIMGLAPYDLYTAVFGRDVVLIWYFDIDPNLSRKNQTLNNTGTMAPRSVTQFGDGDLFYLDSTGIRSLRARDSSNSAATTDIGSPIDDLIAEHLATLSATAVTNATGLIEPRDGRFWLAVGDRIYVFSYFAANKVSAWTEYRPGFVIENMVRWRDRVWLRSGDTIYVYGSLPDAPFQYSDDVNAEAWLPYLDADMPAKQKTLTGVDAAVRGSWEIRAAMDPTDENASDILARVDRTTFGLGDLPAQGVFNHISLRFRSLAPVSATVPAKFSSAVIHFKGGEDKDS
jgi:hypothetical protein